MVYKYKRILFAVLAAWMSLSAFAFNLKTGSLVVVQGDTLQMAPVAKTALKMLQGDIRKVLEAELKLQSAGGGDQNIIVLSKDAAAFAYKKEAFQIKAENGNLYIKGSDDHGLAYGILEVSRLLGVSPWEWWADAKPKHLDSFCLKDGYRNEQAPSVEFRGIFINDEDWGLMPWSGKTYEPSDIKGHIGSKTNARIFELLLRLRANTYWPAMHECTKPFFLTQGNREVAQQYGIYIGGLHDTRRAPPCKARTAEAPAAHPYPHIFPITLSAPSRRYLILFFAPPRSWLPASLRRVRLAFRWCRG